MLSQNNKVDFDMSSFYHLFAAYDTTNVANPITATADYIAIIGIPPTTGSLILYDQPNILGQRLFRFNGVSWTVYVFANTDSRIIYVSYPNQTDGLQNYISATVSLVSGDLTVSDILIQSFPDTICAVYNPTFQYTFGTTTNAQVNASYSSITGQSATEGSYYIIFDTLTSKLNLLVYAYYNGSLSWQLFNILGNSTITVFNPFAGQYYLFSAVYQPTGTEWTYDGIKFCGIASQGLPTATEGTYYLDTDTNNLYEFINESWELVQPATAYIFAATNLGLNLIVKDGLSRIIHSCLSLDQALWYKYALKGFDECTSNPLYLLEDSVSWQIQEIITNAVDVIPVLESPPIGSSLIDLSINLQYQIGSNVQLQTNVFPWNWINVNSMTVDAIATANIVYWYQGQKHTDIRVLRYRNNAVIVLQASYHAQLTASSGGGVSINGPATFDVDTIANNPVIDLIDGDTSTIYTWVPSVASNVNLALVNRAIFQPSALILGSNLYRVSVIINYEYPPQVANDNAQPKFYLIRNNTVVACGSVPKNINKSVIQCMNSVVPVGQVVINCIVSMSSLDTLFVQYDSDGLIIPITLNPGASNFGIGCGSVFSVNLY